MHSSILEYLGSSVVSGSSGLDLDPGFFFSFSCFPPILLKNAKEGIDSPVMVLSSDIKDNAIAATSKSIIESTETTAADCIVIHKTPKIQI
jgi:hypothetical protein